MFSLQKQFPIIYFSSQGLDGYSKSWQKGIYHLTVLFPILAQGARGDDDWGKILKNLVVLQNYMKEDFLTNRKSDSSFP